MIYSRKKEKRTHLDDVLKEEGLNGLGSAGDLHQRRHLALRPEVLRERARVQCRAPVSGCVCEWVWVCICVCVCVSWSVGNGKGRASKTWPLLHEDQLQGGLLDEELLEDDEQEVRVEVALVHLRIEFSYFTRYKFYSYSIE